MSIASLMRSGSKEKKLSVASTVNVMLPRMLQRRNAVSSESVRPGTFDDEQFVIQSYPKSQVQRARIQEILSGIVLFHGLPDNIMKDLVGGFFEMKYSNGDKIIVQGDIIADRFFLLESGQCDIFIKKGSADPIKVHTVLPGGFFGELALLYNAPRAATVQSVGESKLWALDRGTFKNCMARASKEEIRGSSSLMKIVPKSSQLPMSTQQRGAVALIDEQVMKALDQHGLNSVKDQGIPEWNTIVAMSISGEKFFERLLKFNHPHVYIYKLSHMDATSRSLIHSDVTDPRHSIFLPLCKVLPTDTPNSVLLEGHHLDGTITFKFANARDQSQFISIARKSGEIYSMVSDAYQDVRFLSAGGTAQNCLSTSAALTNICGVGLSIDYSKNGRSLAVREIVQGSPAAACGLIDVHDHLLKINNISIKHTFSTLEDVVDAIRGIEGTKVSLEFRKSRGPTARSTYEVSLKRAPNITAQESFLSLNEDTNSQNGHDASISSNTASNCLLSPQDGVNSQNAKDLSCNVSMNDHMTTSESENESKQPEFFQPECSDGSVCALPQHAPKLLDVDEKVSRYVQALSSATAVGSGSTLSFQRRIAQVFATELGMMLLQTHHHRYEVRSIVSNTPASKRNITVGDLLWAINRESVAFKSQEEVCKLLGRPETEVLLSFSRNGTNIHTTIPGRQSANIASVGHMFASATNFPPQFHVSNPGISSRAFNGNRSKLTAAPVHLFDKGSVARLVSTGFSVSKSVAGLFVITSMNACVVRRLEVDDIIVAVDGRVLSRHHSLDDVVCILEEPIGTSAHLILLKDSGGAGGVVRKSTQFVRSVGLPGDEEFNFPFPCHDTDSDTQLDAAHRDSIFKDDLRHSAYFYDADEEIDNCHSECSDASSSSASKNTSSSSTPQLPFASAGVGLAFRLDKICNEFCYVVDRILLQSPADSCGQIDVGDKLVGMNQRSVSVEESLESISDDIMGVEGSQVVLHFIKPDSDMKYSVTLTRSPLVFHRENESPIFTQNAEILQSIRAPFQTSPQGMTTSEMLSAALPVLPSSLPISNCQSSPFGAEAPREAISMASISDSSDRSASSFARSRAQREASTDFNSAFRLKESATAAAIHASATAFSFKNMMFPSSIRAKSLEG